MNKLNSSLKVNFLDFLQAFQPHFMTFIILESEHSDVLYEPEAELKMFVLKNRGKMMESLRSKVHPLESRERIRIISIEILQSKHQR